MDPIFIWPPNPCPATCNPGVFQPPFTPPAAAKICGQSRAVIIRDDFSSDPTAALALLQGFDFDAPFGVAANRIPWGLKRQYNLDTQVWTDDSSTVPYNFPDSFTAVLGGPLVRVSASQITLCKGDAFCLTSTVPPSGGPCYERVPKDFLVYQNNPPDISVGTIAAATVTASGSHSGAPACNPTMLPCGYSPLDP